VAGILAVHVAVHRGGTLWRCSVAGILAVHVAVHRGGTLWRCSVAGILAVHVAVHRGGTLWRCSVAGILAVHAKGALTKSVQLMMAPKSMALRGLSAWMRPHTPAAHLRSTAHLPHHCQHVML
jgi:hypothetical protein